MWKYSENLISYRTAVEGHVFSSADQLLDKRNEEMKNGVVSLIYW